MAQLSTAAAVVRALAVHGTDVVLGIPGTHNLGLYAHLPAHPIRHVTPRHEQGGGYAADAYARVSGRPGVLFATTGPGILNAATALAQAWSDSSPVLAVSPGMPTGHSGRATGLLHEARDQHAAMAALVDRVVRVDSPGAAAVAVRDAFAALRSGRPRPWHLEIPLDRVDDVDEVPDELFLPAAADRPRADPELVRAAAALLVGAERPAVVLGGGARGAGTEALAVVEALGCPAVTSTNGKGVLPESHPSSLGCGLHLAAVQSWLREADVVLVVGCELAESDAWTTQPLVTGRVVRIDLDPEQRDLNAPAADVMIVADAAYALEAVAAELASVRLVGRSRPAVSASLRTAVRQEADTLGARWLPLLRGLRAALPGDVVLATDSAMVAYDGAAGCFPVEEPRSYLFPTGFGTLGFALPAAIGAVLGAPDRPVAALTGDGGLQFTVNELATARSLGRALPVVVVDNGGFGEIRAQQAARGAPAVGVDLAAPEWTQLAAAYGAGCVRVKATSGSAAAEEQVADAVTAALGVARPTLVVVEEEPA
jgi:thiamine pyrophosphate-dependent acetolactate synthase large subunit-like protein